MDIQEIETTELAVKPFDNQHKPPGTLHPDLLQPPFTALMVAPKGCGKSTTILNMLYGTCRGKKKTRHAKEGNLFYRYHFSRIYVMSPTWNLDPKCKKCRIDESQVFEDPDTYEDVVTEILAGQQEDIEADGQAEDIMILFDDCAGTKIFSQKKSVFNKLAFNHRHFRVSILISTQSLRQINPAFRENLSGIFIYAGINNRMELKKIYEEYLGKYTEKEAAQILDYVFRDSPYSFLFINFQKRGALHKNFSRLTITPSDKA